MYAHKHISIIDGCQCRLVSMFNSPKLVIKGVSYRHKKTVSTCLFCTHTVDTVFIKHRSLLFGVNFFFYACKIRCKYTTHFLNYNTYCKKKYIILVACCILVVYTVSLQ